MPHCSMLPCIVLWYMIASQWLCTVCCNANSFFEEIPCMDKYPRTWLIAAREGRLILLITTHSAREQARERWIAREREREQALLPLSASSWRLGTWHQLVGWHPRALGSGSSSSSSITSPRPIFKPQKLGIFCGFMPTPILVSLYTACLIRRPCGRVNWRNHTKGPRGRGRRRRRAVCFQVEGTFSSSIALPTYITFHNIVFHCFPSHEKYNF